MAQQMKAAFFGDKEVVLLREVPVKEPGPGEVLVKVKACGICGSDLRVYKSGELKTEMVRGHEFAGDIMALGANVSGWKVGDRVVVNPVNICRACYWCQRGEYQLCPTAMKGIGLAMPGGMAEFVVVKDFMLRRLPESVSYQEATLVEPLAVALHATRRSGIAVGDSVAIIGAGPIGLLSLLCVKTAGANSVFVVEVAERRSEMARSLGADRVLNPLQKDAVAEIRDAIPIGVDFVFDCVGFPMTMLSAIQMVRSGGKVVLLGNSSSEPAGINLRHLCLNEIKIGPSIGYADEFDLALNLITSQAVDVKPLISRVVPLDDTRLAMESLRTAPEDIKILVEP